MRLDSPTLSGGGHWAAGVANMGSGGRPAKKACVAWQINGCYLSDSLTITMQAK